MFIRGVRGAITVQENSKDAIVSATKDLLLALIQQNDLHVPDLASIFFSVTEDLTAAFPALAARELGLKDTPLLCLTEIPVPGSLPFCIRVLIHVNTPKLQSEMVPVYLKEAISLRPDVVEK